ncbi:CamS family sex pheromone protein [Bacillus thermotolerans]|uniref:Pheromone cAM373 lipoprotein CamS n=1 Tax=Bacillus thermotolerans TaxID=1221996 RepID=A0A0F5I461_BACTR|nr:CamS family sex pheromone protein [Bacillus thermotolerans]KKB35728.1 putative pheromone cAM373 precursor lipoprotein CamS [Bacillus thermotolerans]KKB40035.1 putative pheromone cAM373 precursor lipoprotein CamS [Bacillus thermotolerans]KKB43644.1 putative pheromone cAM373 precursor lipoprotein CamS [Bacillus thermotolerans]
MNKRIFSAALAVMLLISGCAPDDIENEKEVIQGDGEQEKAIIPNYQLSESYYRTIVPYKPGKARGMVVSNLNTRYDIVEFETGLMRIAQEHFSPDTYLFQEGQMIEANTIRSWLSRKYTEEQLKERELKPEENLGLNPVDNEEGSVEERNEKSPIYLAHIMEHNYLTKTEDNSLQLSGAVIGLALNSVHYYTKEKYGAVYDYEIPDEVVEREGKKIAEEVAKRVRQMEGLKDVPVTIALFKQESRDSVVPGNFIAYTHLEKNENAIKSWETVNEKYYLLPSDEAERDHRDDATYFLNFKQDIEEQFDNHNGIVGTALYNGDQLVDLKIDIPIEFYGKAEATGFTQYVTGLVMDHFPAYVPIEVNIYSNSGPEALIVREAENQEPRVYVYK